MWNKSWGEHIYTAHIGHLFVYVFENEQETYPDGEVVSVNYNWYLCLDSDDKCDERALSRGNEKSLDDVKFEVLMALRKIINMMETDLRNTR